MQKLAELEATAPKVTKKKMLNEDSATPPMNVSNKPASLKDVFAALSENVAPGQKPLPVLDPQKKQAGYQYKWQEILLCFFHLAMLSCLCEKPIVSGVGRCIF